MCVEVLDGLRICFNTFLFRQLLVNEDEQAQYYEVLKMSLQPPISNIPQYDQELVFFNYILIIYLKIGFLRNGEQEHNNAHNGEEMEMHVSENKSNGRGKIIH